MKIKHRRETRLAAGVLAAATALAVTPIVGFTGTASAADDPPPVADPIGTGNVCEDMPEEEPFDDVEQSDSSYDEIVCLFQADITQGKTADTYVPAGTLTRREMALFLKRTADTADANEADDEVAALPAYDGEEDYDDIADETAAVKEAVGQLDQAGIALGFADGTYRPGATLKRRQMARFVVRLVEYLTGEELPAAEGDYFDDDADEAEAVQEAFNQLAEAGIFAGDGQGNVDPGGDLSRRQMANILTRTLEVLLEGGDIEQLFVEGTPPPPPPAGTTILDVTATEDSTFPGQVDGGDVHRFVFSDPMDESVAADDAAYQVTAVDETEATVTCGDATCELNQSAVSIGGEVHEAHTVLTVTLGPTFGLSNPGVEYPVTVTAVTTDWIDAEGADLDLEGSDDVEIEVDPEADETEQIPPTVENAVQSDETPDELLLTFSEPITFIGAPGNFNVIQTEQACDGETEPVSSGYGQSVSSDDGDELLEVAFQGDIAAGDYRLCVYVNQVEDLDGTPNQTQSILVSFI